MRTLEKDSRRRAPTTLDRAAEIFQIHQKALAITRRYTPAAEDIEVPMAPTPIQDKVRKQITRLFQGWISSDRTIDLEIYDAYEKGDQNLFNTHQNSDFFEEFYAEAEAEAIYKDESDVTEREFRGGLFASIASAYLEETSGYDYLFLGADKTLAITKTIHPDAREIRNPYGAIGLDGFYVPDGLRVEKINGRIKITGVYEMSLSGKLEKYVDQLDGFYQFKRDLGPVATPAKFVIVIDRGNPVSFPAEAYIDVDILPLPFLMDEFNEYANNVKKLYRRSTDHATLVELRNWRREEARKITDMGEPSFYRGEYPVIITKAGYKRVLRDPD